MINMMSNEVATKITFLDVDGVLNDNTTKVAAPSGCVGVMDSKVKLLKTIIDLTGAKVVLSSDWKLCEPGDRDYQYLENKLWYKGGIRIYGKTPDIDWQCRGQEILAWLGKHPQVTSWVVLDDIMFEDFSRPGFAGHLVITDYRVGLMDLDALKAIMILRGEYVEEGEDYDTDELP